MEKLDCGHTLVKNGGDGIGVGYGINKDGKKFCYQCCAIQDIEYMATHDRICLYLTTINEKWVVTNWPNSLQMAATVSIKPNGHNWGITRRDAWFTDANNNKWWGVQYGDNTEIIHCKKLHN